MLKIFLLSLFVLAEAAVAATPIDATWAVKDSKLAASLTATYAAYRSAAVSGNVAEFTKLSHPYRFKEMTNNMTQVKMSLTPELLKGQIAPALEKLQDAKFMKTSATTAIVIYEVKHPEDPPPNDRVYEAVEFLKDGNDWKLGNISGFPVSKNPELPERLTLNPQFPALATATAPEFVGYFSVTAHGFDVTVAINGAPAVTYASPTSAAAAIPAGLKKQNEVEITLKPGKTWPAPMTGEVEFLTRGATEMVSHFKKTYTKPGTYKETFSVK